MYASLSASVPLSRTWTNAHSGHIEQPGLTWPLFPPASSTLVLRRAPRWGCTPRATSPKGRSQRRLMDSSGPAACSSGWPRLSTDGGRGLGDYAETPLAFCNQRKRLIEGVVDLAFEEEDRDSYERQVGLSLWLSDPPSPGPYQPSCFGSEVVTPSPHRRAGRVKVPHTRNCRRRQYCRCRRTWPPVDTDRAVLYDRLVPRCCAMREWRPAPVRARPMTPVRRPNRTYWAHRHHRSAACPAP